MVYVLNKEGKPLMPTSDHRKVRLMYPAQKFGEKFSPVQNRR